MRSGVWGVLLMVTAAAAVQAETRLDEKRIEKVVKESFGHWQTPGIAVAVVRGAESRVTCLGVREVGRTAPVTPSTIFAYASLTKAFTCACIGILKDERKMHWDDPVRQHLDWFRLADPLADREVRIRDLLCHRIGLGRHDILWYRANESPEQTVRRMAFLEPDYSFRARYQYNNLAYMAAGLAIEKAAGMPWHQLVEKRLCGPLGMRDVVFTAGAARAREDHATPHRRDKSGKNAPIQWYPDDRQIRASGSMKGSIRDLIPWMQMQLAEGTFEGKQVLSTESLKEMHTPQIVVPLPRAQAKMKETTQASYGLGWQIYDYRGWQILEHGGANDGFRGRIVLVPRAKLGIALLINSEEADLLQATGNRLLDELLGLKAKDWVSYYRKQGEPSPDKSRVTRKPGTMPSRELSAYGGKYRDAAYGTVQIQQQGKGLKLAWSSFEVEMTHYHYDTFQIQAKGESQSQLVGELVTFQLDANANVASLRFLGRTFQRGR